MWETWEVPAWLPGGHCWLCVGGWMPGHCINERGCPSCLRMFSHLARAVGGCRVSVTRVTSHVVTNITFTHYCLSGPAPGAAVPATGCHPGHTVGTGFSGQAWSQPAWGGAGPAAGPAGRAEGPVRGFPHPVGNAAEASASPAGRAAEVLAGSRGV